MAAERADPLLASHVCLGQRPGRGVRRAGGHHGHPGGLEHPVERQAVHRADVVHHGDIGQTGPDRVVLRIPVGVEVLEAQPGALGPEQVAHVLPLVGQPETEHRYPQHAVIGGRLRPGDLRQLVHPREGALRHGDEPLARGRERHPAAGATEQRTPSSPSSRCTRRPNACAVM